MQSVIIKSNNRTSAGVYEIPVHRHLTAKLNEDEYRKIYWRTTLYGNDIASLNCDRPVLGHRRFDLRCRRRFVPQDVASRRHWFTRRSRNYILAVRVALFSPAELLIFSKWGETDRRIKNRLHAIVITDVGVYCKKRTERYHPAFIVLKRADVIWVVPLAPEITICCARSLLRIVQIS